MAFIEIDDVIFNELQSIYPEKVELRQQINMQLAKLLPSVTKRGRQVLRKNTSVRLTEEQQKWLDEVSGELDMPRVDLLSSMLADIDPNSLELPNVSQAGTVLRTNTKSPTYLISFNPPVELHTRWLHLARAAHMSGQRFMDTLVRHYMKQPTYDWACLQR